MVEILFWNLTRNAIKVSTQFGTQKGAERAFEAVDATNAVRNFLR